MFLFQHLNWYLLWTVDADHDAYRIVPGQQETIDIIRRQTIPSSHSTQRKSSTHSHLNAISTSDHRYSHKLHAHFQAKEIMMTSPLHRTAPLHHSMTHHISFSSRLRLIPPLLLQTIRKNSETNHQHSLNIHSIDKFKRKQKIDIVYGRNNFSKRKIINTLQLPKQKLINKINIYLSTSTCQQLLACGQFQHERKNQQFFSFPWRLPTHLFKDRVSNIQVELDRKSTQIRFSQTGL